MISYEPFWNMLKKKGVSTYSLIQDYGVNPNTITRIRDNGGITMYTLEKLCMALECTPNDILSFVSENNSEVCSKK